MPLCVFMRNIWIASFGDDLMVQTSVKTLHEPKKIYKAINQFDVA